MSRIVCAPWRRLCAGGGRRAGRGVSRLGREIPVELFIDTANVSQIRRWLDWGVIDGVTRDIDEYKQLNLPVYGRGFIQQSIRNRCACAGYGIEVQLGGIGVKPGDLIVADENGICVVPQDKLAEVLQFAKLFKSIEDGIVEAVRSGVDPVEAHDRVRYDLMTRAGYQP